MKNDTSKTIFPAYKVKTYGGIPVAFIGLTLKATPSIVSAAGIKDVEFRDEADTVNALIPELKNKVLKPLSSLSMKVQRQVRNSIKNM